MMVKKRRKPLLAFAHGLSVKTRLKQLVKNTVNCVKRFSYVLNTGDASPLLTLSHRDKHHAMGALATMPNILAGLQPLYL
ncbi:MAG TPA: hypothetical protein VHF65_02730 [Nitrososphaera sp.]|nr:hypothetical protein [Nitrososphaera sp.]